MILYPFAGVSHPAGRLSVPPTHTHLVEDPVCSAATNRQRVLTAADVALLPASVSSRSHGPRREGLFFPVLDAEAQAQRAINLVSSRCKVRAKV